MLKGFATHHNVEFIIVVRKLVHIYWLTINIEYFLGSGTSFSGQIRTSHVNIEDGASKR